MTRPRKSRHEKSANAGRFLKEGTLLWPGKRPAGARGLYETGISSRHSFRAAATMREPGGTPADDAQHDDERKFLRFFMPAGRLKSTLASPVSQWDHPANIATDPFTTFPSRFDIKAERYNDDMAAAQRGMASKRAKGEAQYRTPPGGQGGRADINCPRSVYK